ncbi:MAG: hypothetical protein JWQ75_4278 [Pseudarthrobacter sp.]|nr:hypothetical protein [Pseudarthrobacter sp.]
MKIEDGQSGSAGGPGTDSAAPSLGTLVIRTWWEPDHAQGFRARVTSTRLPETGSTTVTTADPEEVLAAVRQWLLARPGAAGDQ